MKKGLKIFSIVILSIISAVAILGAIAFVVIMVIALDADPIIREAYPSPNGDCQIEVVDYWMDAHPNKTITHISVVMKNNRFPKRFFIFKISPLIFIYYTFQIFFDII